MDIELHPEADSELIEAALFYESRVDGLGESLLKEFDNLTRLLRINPKIGAPVNEMFKRVVLIQYSIRLNPM